MVKEIMSENLSPNDLMELLRHITNVLNINTAFVKEQTKKIRELNAELDNTKDVVERWLKLGREHNEMQTVFWDDDIVNLLKYLRGEEIE